MPTAAITTPVVCFNLRKVRREMPDEDLRRVALARLRDIVLQDEGFIHLAKEVQFVVAPRTFAEGLRFHASLDDH